MNRIIALAINTFREAIRARVLYVLIAVGLVIIGCSTVFAPMTMGEGPRITTDLGLTLIEVLGLLIITLLGTTIIYKEFERRTVMVLLSKPVRRHEFLIGKFLGMTMTLLLMVVVETLFVQAALWIGAGDPDIRIFWGAGMAFAMLTTLNAISTLFSSFAGPMVAAFLTFATFLAGKLIGDLVTFAELQRVAAVRYFYYLLPNLASLDVRAEIVHHMAIEPGRVVLALAHGMSYSAAALILAVLAFRDREFR